MKKRYTPFMVVIPSELDTEGKLRKRYFGTLNEATEYLSAVRARLREHALGLSGDALADAVAARCLLRDFYASAESSPNHTETGETGDGVTLVEVARQHIAAQREKAKMARAVRHSFAELADGVCSAKGDRTARYVAELRRAVLAFGAFCGDDVPVDGVDALRVDAWLASILHPRTRAYMRTLIGVAYEWAVRKGWVAGNVVRRSEAVRVVSGETRIFTVSQVRALLAACRELGDVEMLRWLGILIFAGVRVDEVARLDWRDVQARHIEITAGKSKTATRRAVEILPPLEAILQGKPTDGPVKPVNWRRRLQAIRDASGVEWHQDICRHTYASMHLAAYENAGKTMLEMGHASADVLFRHYRQLVSKADALEFWRIII